jgi:hypothetical protein
MADAARSRGLVDREADDGLRTRDLQLGKLALYQLSYVRARGYSSMVPPAGELRPKGDTA